MPAPKRVAKKKAPTPVNAPTRWTGDLPGVTFPGEVPPGYESRAHLHKERAKRWGTPSPWVAEWFENAVRFCKTPEGRLKFETWLREQVPPDHYRDIVREMAQPPVKKSGSSWGNAQMWNSAAYELGISDEAMRQYHSFTAANNLVPPERTLPAVKRKKGESRADYLTRRHQSLLQGCKVPDVDWHELRKISTSQYDAIRYTFEAWHTDLDYYSDVVKTRASTTIALASVLEQIRRGPSPQFIEERQLRTDAYRSTLFLMHLGHAFWSKATSALEDLAAQGLVTSSAIERAYKKDPHLKWRLIMVGQLGQLYNQKSAARMSTVFARLPAFHNYIRQSRSDDGNLHLDLNRSYLATHPYRENAVEQVVVEMCTNPLTGFYGYFDQLNTILRGNPNEALKFNSNAWDEIGTLADICDFNSAFFQSAWGQGLVRAANEPLSTEEEKIMIEELCFMDPAKFEPDELFKYTNYQIRYAGAEKIVYDMANTWNGLIFDPEMTPDDFLIGSTLRDLEGPRHELFCDKNEIQMHFKLIPAFDMLWMMTDAMMWEKAASLDPPGKKGLVAKTFGLWDPRDKNRPLYVKIFAEKMKVQKREASTETASQAQVKKPEYLPPFAVVGSQGQSGRSYVAANAAEGKEKVKTRGDAVKAPDDAVNDGEEGVDELPDLLPDNFKLPKKAWKMFDRLLEGEVPNDTSQKKGQIRWGDFEKGMRRLGFDVVQAAGSSVRFDPPAKRARPISFHRPHPDSLLTPHLIKWVGARLKRTYGWTTNTFQRKEGEAECANELDE